MLITDPLDILLDEDGDLFVGPAGFVMASGPDGVAQLCRIAIRLVLGEWFLNQSKGVDWFRYLQEKFRAEDVSSGLRAALLGVPTVTGVASIRTQRPAADRRASVEVTVNSTFGDVTVAVEIGELRG